MTRFCLLLFAVLTIVSNASAALVVAKANAIKWPGDRLLADSESTTSVKKRSLRSVNTPDDSERTVASEVAMLGKSKGVVDDVFKLLNLNTVLDDLLSHANWGAWVKYVEDSIPQNHRKDVLLETLLKHYDDQHTLSMLTKAMEDPSTTEIATALESHLSQAIKNQVNIWKDKRLGPGDVLKAFPAGEYASLDDIVGSNFLNSWVRYVDNVAPDADKVSEILTPLISRFGTDGVMNAIASSSAAQSKSLEDLLFKNWLGGPRVQSRTVEIVKRFVRSAFGNNVPKRVDDIVARYAVRYEKEGKTANDILRNIEATIARTATL